ncbi:helix-turn-helix transcriptional regulator [Sansalvadorimonas verongulae]|uniref:helix-turn-helix transcriptional regulator n=1 Tax=Sansalvadorimonas verongulae TaxID=2172824 RepID=UPI0012BC0334|nr:AlpA family phage regulatory protein [Sansalvadorimonas verongulae]MTI12110.1 AlpA family phage regulatory protein [Sansalvadorimonas verongulae]
MAYKDSQPAPDKEAITQVVEEAIARVLDVQKVDDVKLVRRQFIEETFGISRSTIYRLMAAGELPLPVSIPGGGVRWVHSELMEWAQTHIKERDLK